MCDLFLRALKLHVAGVPSAEEILRSALKVLGEEEIPIIQGGVVKADSAAAAAQLEQQ